MRECVCVCEREIFKKKWKLNAEKEINIISFAQKAVLMYNLHSKKWLIKSIVYTDLKQTNLILPSERGTALPSIGNVTNDLTKRQIQNKAKQSIFLMSNKYQQELYFSWNMSITINLLLSCIDWWYECSALLSIQASIKQYWPSKYVLNVCLRFYVRVSVLWKCQKWTTVNKIC